MKTTSVHLVLELRGEDSHLNYACGVVLMWCTTLMSSKLMRAKQLSVAPILRILDDWEVVTGCHLNRTLVSHLLQTLVLSAGWHNIQ